MRREELIRWIATRGCVTARDAAKVLGVSLYTARQRLQRLRRRGVLRVVWRRRTAWWCVPGAAPPVAPRVVPGVHRQNTVVLLQKAEESLSAGCVTTTALMNTLGVGHTQAFYVLRLLRESGRAVEVSVGRVALWCRDRETATRFVEELTAVVRRLVERQRLRYVTPKRLFELITRDAEARQAFSRVINVKAPSASVYSVLKTLLEAVYGEPIKRSIYYTQQVAVGHVSIDIKDMEVGEYVAVMLTPDLAEALSGVGTNEVVLHAIEQLLARYRS